MHERLATAEEAVQAAEAAKSASQDQAQKAEQLSQLERRLAQVAELSPEPVQQLTASVDELRSKMASTPWTQDTGLFKAGFGDLRLFMVTVRCSYVRNLSNV